MITVLVIVIAAIIAYAVYSKNKVIGDDDSSTISADCKEYNKQVLSDFKDRKLREFVMETFLKMKRKEICDDAQCQKESILPFLDTKSLLELLENHATRFQGKKILILDQSTSTCTKFDDKKTYIIIRRYGSDFFPISKNGKYLFDG